MRGWPDRQRHPAPSGTSARPSAPTRATQDKGAVLRGGAGLRCAAVWRRAARPCASRPAKRAATFRGDPGALPDRTLGRAGPTAVMRASSRGPSASADLLEPPRKRRRRRPRSTGNGSRSRSRAPGRAARLEPSSSAARRGLDADPAAAICCGPACAPARFELAARTDVPGQGRDQRVCRAGAPVLRRERAAFVNAVLDRVAPQLRTEAPRL